MEQIRAVVQLSDSKTDRKPNYPGAGSPGRDQDGGQVSILDDHSLRLLRCQNKKSKPHLLMSQNLHFDVLSTRESGQEIPVLLENLFGKKRDAFLIHLKVRRECHLMFLLDTLVIQVRSKLQSQGLRIEQGALWFRKLLEDDGVGNHLKTYHSFGDLHELMLWLLNQYRMRAQLSTGPGHEALEVQYMVSPEDTRIPFSVRLSILLVATEELSVESLLGLRYYFNDEQTESEVVSTELIDFMQRVIELGRRNSLYMPVFFHVMATNSQVDKQNAQLLSLAHLASRHNRQPINLCFNHLNHLETQQKEIEDRFRLVHASLMRCIQKAEQLKSYRKRFDEQLAEYEELLKQTAHTEFGQFLSYQ
ncbi:uncharacterized protein [Drosophila takahashii]|uniref:uncharacterized protein n=1 Tax=Drosophila takahashii TaxID=29030 RepID=UPI00389928E0